MTMATNDFESMLQHDAKITEAAINSLMFPMLLPTMNHLQQIGFTHYRKK